MVPASLTVSCPVYSPARVRESWDAYAAFDVIGNAVLDALGLPRKESRDATGHEHDASGKFGSGGGTVTHDDAEPGADHPAARTTRSSWVTS